MLAAAFFEYPMFAFYFPDRSRRSRSLPWYFRNVLRCAVRYGEVWTTPTIAGVLFTLPPGHTRLSIPEYVRNGFLFAPLVLGFANYRRSMQCEGFVDRTQKDVMKGRPHYNLWGVAVDPAEQGRDVGDALLRAFLTRTDADGVPVYLETHDERNVRYYKKYGFELMRETSIPTHGLRIWCRPRPPPCAARGAPEIRRPRSWQTGHAALDFLAMTCPDAQDKRIGLALASGGARGAAITGVLKVLDREGIRASVVTGSSIGSLVGAAYAAGLPIEEVEREWLAIDRSTLVRGFLPTLSRAGLSSGSELRKLLSELLGDGRIEQLAIPFAAVACDIDTGDVVVLHEGPLAEAVRASCAVPGLFHPVRWGDRLLVDGGLVEPLPVRPCRELGANFVIAVDISPRPQPTTERGRSAWIRLGEQLQQGLNQREWIPSSLTEFLEHVFRDRPESARPLPGLYSILNQSIAILIQQVLEQKLLLHPPDVLIRPPVSQSFMEYRHAEEAIACGEQAAEAALPELRQRLADG